MVVPNKGIANLNSFSIDLATSNSIKPNIVSKDIYMDSLKGRSNTLSLNFLRELLAH